MAPLVVVHMGHTGVTLTSYIGGEGAVAKWSEVQLEKEKTNENQKIQGLPTDLGNS